MKDPIEQAIDGMINEKESSLPVEEVKDQLITMLKDAFARRHSGSESNDMMYFDGLINLVKDVEDVTPIISSIFK